MHLSFQSLLRTAALAALALLAAPVASAAGLVQVTLTGNLDQTGGMRLELICDAGGREAHLRGHFAQDTRPGDLAALFVRRLKASGIAVVPGPDSGPRGPYSFFVEECEGITVRVGGGLEARLTAVEEAPLALRFLPPRSKSASPGGDLRIFLSTESVADHKEDVVTLELELPSGRTSSTWVAEHLGSAAMARGLKSRRPSPDAWSSSGTTSGALTVGASIELYSDADWGIEMRLTPLVGSR
jgi:hypothetical protein